MDDGYLSTRESGGFIFWPQASGTFIMNGGTIDAPQLRSAGGVDGLATFIQTARYNKFAGPVCQRGYRCDPNDVRTVPIDYVANINANSLDGNYGTFNIASPSNVFSMKRWHNQYI